KPPATDRRFQPDWRSPPRAGFFMPVPRTAAGNGRLRGGAILCHRHRTGHGMSALTSQLDPRSQDFLDNAHYHRALVEELDRRLARAADGGGEKTRDKHTERGKLLARDRIAALLDPGSPFLEIAPLAA